MHKLWYELVSLYNVILFWISKMICKFEKLYRLNGLCLNIYCLTTQLGFNTNSGGTLPSKNNQKYIFTCRNGSSSVDRETETSFTIVDKRV